MIPATWIKNSVSNVAPATKNSGAAAQPTNDLDPVKGLAIAVPIGLACWGLFGWLLWRLL